MDSISSSVDDVSLLRFLYCLRTLLRSAYSACVITIPTHLYENHAYISRVRNLCDVVVRLESFANTPLSRDDTYKEYHGLFHVVKAPRLNTLAHHHADTDDLVFKLRRKRFTIEKLHLPPCLQENAGSDAAKKSSEISIADEPAMSMGCGTAINKSKLDF
jgi:elongator complex protein 4